MTSNNHQEPAFDPIERFSDQVFRGDPAADSVLDADLAAAIHALKAQDTVPALDRLRTKERKALMMQQIGTVTVPISLNGHQHENVRTAPTSFPAGLNPRKVSLSWLGSAASIAAVLAMLVTVALAGRTLLPNDDKPQAIVPAPIVQQDQPANVTMYRGDTGRAGSMPGPGPVEMPVELWHFATGGAVATAPILIDGVLYVGSNDGNLYALDSNSGAKIWAFAGSEAMGGTPFAEGELVYATDGGGTLYAINRIDGSESWRFTKAIASAIGVIGDGTLYVQGSDNAVHGLNPATGEETWSSPLTSDARRSVSYANGVVYAASADSVLHAISAETGLELWSTRAADVSGLPTTAIANGLVFQSSAEGTSGAFVVLDAATGEERWQISGLEGFLPPAVGPSAVFVPSPNGVLYALDIQTGAELWKLETTDQLRAAPALVDNTLYAGGYDGNLYALSTATGGHIWTYPVEGEIDFGPIVSGGRIYFGSLNGNVYALGSDPNVGSTPSATDATTVPATSATFDQQSIQLLWQTNGDPNSPLAFPEELAIDSAGNINLINAHNNRIDVFSPGGQYIETWGTSGSGAGQFAFVSDGSYGGDIGVDADGNIYVFDSFNYRIQKFDSNHQFLLEWGSFGNGNGEFSSLFGTVDAANGLVYVAEIDNNRIQVFDLEGNYLDKWGSFGTEPGQLRGPTNIAIDDAGNVYVTQETGGGVLKFDPTGRYLGSIGDELLMQNVWGIDFDPAGNLFVIDAGANKLHIFSPDGAFIATVTGVPGHDPFVTLSQILIDEAGATYLVEEVDGNTLMRVQFPPIPEVED